MKVIDLIMEQLGTVAERDLQRVARTFGVIEEGEGGVN